VKICPCCGYKSESVLNRVLTVGEEYPACKSCAARPVGEPLPHPARQLPSFGRSLILAVMGAFLVLLFLTQTIIALLARAPLSLGFWSWIAAAETAAWRLKFVMIPFTMLVLYGGGKLYRSIRQSPIRFCGVRYAFSGYLASAAVPLLVLIFIGITVPERLRRQQWGIEAGESVHRLRYDRALDEYRDIYGTLPSYSDGLRKLPDADGSIAAALNNLDTSGYRPSSADLAAVPTKKPQPMRGLAIRNASIITADDAPSERVSFTNYELPLPGPDKIIGNEDDLILRDGVVYPKPPETPGRNVTTAGATQTRKP
jgi:hypothetical protein